MAGSVNKVIIVGNLGKDPELRRTPGGAAVTDFSVATTDKFKGKDGSKQETTEWHNIVVWNKQAENACQYLKKGSSVYVEGSLRTRSWDDQNGQKKYKTEILAQSIQFLDKFGNTAPQNEQSASDGFGEPPANEQQAPAQSNQAVVPGVPAPIDQDLPF